MLTEPTARSRTPTARATIHRKRIPKRPTRLNIGSQPIEPGLGDLMCHKGDMRTRWKQMLRQRQVANDQITTARMTTSPTQPTTTRNVPGRGRFALAISSSSLGVGGRSGYIDIATIPFVASGPATQVEHTSTPPLMTEAPQVLRRWRQQPASTRCTEDPP